MSYVDTHCHVDQYAKPLEVLKRAEATGTVTVAVTELPSGFQRLALRLGSRRLVRVALGMHPLRAAAASPMDLALFAELLDQTDYVGEVGLDGSQAGRASLRSQVSVFEHLLQQPRVKRKVLTVHSRGAEAETIERLSQAGVTAILHWYSGALKHIDVAASAGLWFSVNPAMLRSHSGQRIVAALPPERVVTETDGPYAKLGGRPCEPSDIPSVVTGLARAWGEEPEQARCRVFDNMAAIAAAARAGDEPDRGVD
jgi:TatD DNase family protein